MVRGVHVFFLNAYVSSILNDFAFTYGVFQKLCLQDFFFTAFTLSSIYFQTEIKSTPFATYLLKNNVLLEVRAVGANFQRIASVFFSLYQCTAVGANHMHNTKYSKTVGVNVPIAPTLNDDPGGFAI